MDGWAANGIGESMLTTWTGIQMEQELEGNEEKKEDGTKEKILTEAQKEEIMNKARDEERNKE